MTHDSAIIALLKKYDFRREIAPEMRKRLLESKRKVYGTIRASRPELRPAGLLHAVFGPFYMMNRKAALALSMAVVAAVTGVLILTGIPGLRLPFTNGTSPLLARVVFVAGDVRVEQGGTESRLALGSDITAGASVLTGPGGVAVLQVDELGTVRVNESSRFTFGAIDGRGDTELALDRGSIYSKLLKRGAGQSYRVKTHSYTAAVRGTEFLAVSSEREKSIMVMEGVVGVATPVSSAEVAKGKGLTVGAAGEVKEYALGEKEMLMLRRQSLYPYQRNARSMSAGELTAVSEGIRTREAEIDTLLAASDGDSAVSPLDRLRKKGMPLTMVHLRDGSQIAGSVVGQEEKKLRLDTGDGIVEIPVDEIIRRVPMN